MSSARIAWWIWLRALDKTLVLQDNEEPLAVLLKYEIFWQCRRGWGGELVLSWPRARRRAAWLESSSHTWASNIPRSLSLAALSVSAPPIWISNGLWQTEQCPAVEAPNST